MMQPIKTAVILAAGLGLRLRDVWTGKPKGLLAIEEICLVERSIQQLIAHGIKEIIIVTGYLAKHYGALAQEYSIVKTIHNPYYAESGSMYSLYCARTLIRKSFLLLESDLLYEARALSALLNDPHMDAVLISDVTQSNDEAFVEARNGCLFHMSKNQHELTMIIGEMAGMAKISLPLYEQMIVHAERYFHSRDRHWHYEDGCLNQISKEQPIPLCVVPDLVWCEIDNAEHLRRARQVIWPRIQQIDG